MDSNPQQRNELLHLKDIALDDDVLHQAIEKLRAVLDVEVGVGGQLAEAVEDLIKEWENAPAADLQ